VIEILLLGWSSEKLLKKLQLERKHTMLKNRITVFVDLKFFIIFSLKKLIFLKPVNSDSANTSI
jgi:hypothetical protein